MCLSREEVRSLLFVADVVSSESPFGGSVDFDVSLSGHRVGWSQGRNPQELGPYSAANRNPRTQTRPHGEDRMMQRPPARRRSPRWHVSHPGRRFL
jgi:hypothetical protein